MSEVSLAPRLETADCTRQRLKAPTERKRDTAEVRRRSRGECDGWMPQLNAVVKHRGECACGLITKDTASGARLK